MRKDLLGILGSKWFFGIIISVFGAYCLYLSFTMSYPMAFDESYHFTLIEFYSNQLSPFISSQPPELASVGDATRLTSYLSHYILSFPLRITSLFTSDIFTQVIVLRGVNIGFVITALILFGVFTKRLFGSILITNLTTLAYCLLPVSSYLSAHINYDNALLLCFAASLVLVQNAYIAIRSKKIVRIGTIMALFTVLAAGCLIKFTFVPVAIAIGVGLLVYVILRKRQAGLGISYGKAVGTLGISLVLVCFVGLAVERFGGNLVQYGTPLPDCLQVQPLDTCLQYGPWARNYHLQLSAANESRFDGGSLPGYLVKTWAPIMVTGIGMVASPSGATHTPLSLALVVKIAMFGILAGLTVATITHRKNPIVLILASASVFYVGLLVYRNYSEYLRFHEPVAIQGRYVIFLLIPIAAVSIKSLIDLRKNQFVNLLSFLRSAHPDEAYERSLDYWSLKVWRRTAEN